MKSSKETLVELVKATGQEVIDRAEDFVGNGDMIADFDIWIRFSENYAPTIEITRRHTSKNVYNVLAQRG